MQAYQRDFIELAIKAEALSFGEFTLKSGRVSPYFFNAGKFCMGAAIATLGRCYAEALLRTETPFDIVFGPAYKGIPLATATAAALADHHQKDVPYCYNRKEAKDHGEGGVLVGPPLQGKRIAIVDDVITAGTAVREVLSIISENGADVAVIVVGLNRQERGKADRSAIEELVDETGVPVSSIVDLSHITHFLEATGETATLKQVQAYRQQYGTRN